MRRVCRKICAISCWVFIAGGSWGCSFFKTLAGTNTIDLAKAEVKSMSVDIRKDQKTICPREPVQMAVFAEVLLEGQPQAASFETWQGRGNVNKNDRLDFPDFAFHSPQGSFDEDGWFIPNPDLLATVATEFELTTAYKRRPDKFTFTMTYKPDYGCVRNGGAKPAHGGMGMTGTSGPDGKEGSYGSDSTRGGDGTDGGSGSPGGSGNSGGQGARIEVVATMVRTEFYDKLVAVRLSGGMEDFLLFHPEQVLTISATGGAGGPGGNGGNGGQGGRGGSGNPGGNGGHGGPGGNGGNGGNGGTGGEIQLTFDSRFGELSQLIRLDVTGGPGGSPGQGGGGGRAGSGGTGLGQGMMGSSGSDGSSGNPGAMGQSGTPGNASARAGEVGAAFDGITGITVL
jgi:hypothetical protein